MEKQCSACGELKPETEYQKRAMSNDGLTASCKSCLKARDALRFKNDPRVRDRHKRYQETDSGKESMKKAKMKWQEQNPEKRAAHVILGNRIRDGQVIKPDTCQGCGCKPSRLHGHHHDYSKPLDVEWLCPGCHADRHKDDTQ